MIRLYNVSLIHCLIKTFFMQNVVDHIGLTELFTFVSCYHLWFFPKVVHRSHDRIQSEIS